MVRMSSASTSAHPIAQIFTVQGHPEYTPDIVHKMIDVREVEGKIDAATATEARRRAGGKDGSGGEGYGRVGWAIWRVMLPESKYNAIDRILDRRGPWTAEEFVGGQLVSVVSRRAYAVETFFAYGCKGSRDWGRRFGLRDSTEPCAQ